MLPATRKARTHDRVLDHRLAERLVALGRAVADVVPGLVPARVDVMTVEVENLERRVGGAREY